MLKTRYNLLFLLALTALVFQSFNDPYVNLKKRITDKQYKYEFYTTTKKLRPRTDIIYYWFKGGAIHTSQEGIAGELLDSQFEKFYLNNQLAERGVFKKGKKIGKWRTWHLNGILATEAEWAGGQKNGNFYSYNEEGTLIEKGLYRVDKKQGKWVNFSKRDTVTYRNDNIVLKKVKKTKEEKEVAKSLKKSEKEKRNKELKKQTNKAIQESKKAKKADTSTSDKKINKENKNTTPENKESFFKKWFSKKEKTKPADGKGS